MNNRINKSIPTILAEFPLVAAHTRTLATDTMSVTVAVGHLAFVVAHRALLALPARIALALAVDVVAALRAQHRADTFVFMD